MSFNFLGWTPPKELLDLIKTPLSSRPSPDTLQQNSLFTWCSSPSSLAALQERLRYVTAASTFPSTASNSQHGFLPPRTTTHSEYTHKLFLGGIIEAFRRFSPMCFDWNFEITQSSPPRGYITFESGCRAPVLLLICTDNSATGPWCYRIRAEPNNNREVRIYPYALDSYCLRCSTQPGRYFCRESSCFGYFCKKCWPRHHNIINTVLW